MKHTCFLYLTALFFVLWLKPVHSQVSIAPSSVFISDQSNMATIYVSNRSDEPQEVSIDFVFGYPSSDENGAIVMNYDAPELEEQFGLGQWMRVFPRSFVIGPQQQQTVRLQVRPQPQAEDGVYWSRIRFNAAPQTPEIDLGPATEEGITTRVTFRFEQIIAAFYKKGRTTTGLNIQDVEVRQEEDRLVFLSHLERTGNSPFIGSVHVRLYDQANNLVAERQSTTTAYFNEIRRIDLDIADIEAGNYRAELTYATRRSDISPTDLVQAEPVSRVLEVSIP